MYSTAGRATEINHTARVLPYSFVRMTFKARSVAALPKVS